MSILMYLWHALNMSFGMFWEILWSLALGFGFSAVIQAVISKGEMSGLLPNNRLGTLWRASWLGAISSSCSYAAVAILSFVCSIGNVPLAAVLWNGGISFIFADLLILPILSIYRKYYGVKMALFLAITSYVAMVLAGLTVEGLFSLLHLIPAERHALALDLHITLNYTAVLNIVFLVISGLLLTRYLETGGPEMMAMMDGPDGGHGHHGPESHRPHMHPHS